MEFAVALADPVGREMEVSVFQARGLRADVCIGTCRVNVLQIMGDGSSAEHKRTLDTWLKLTAPRENGERDDEVLQGASSTQNQDVCGHVHVILAFSECFLPSVEAEALSARSLVLTASVLSRNETFALERVLTAPTATAVDEHSEWWGSSLADVTTIGPDGKQEPHLYDDVILALDCRSVLF